MPHDDNEFRIFSMYFKYHIKMYVESLLWLYGNSEKPNSWDTIRNAIIEDNLIHARILIDFFLKSGKYPTDFNVDDFSVGTKLNIDSKTLTFLKDQSNNIGSQLVHLTSKAMPALKSQQAWPIFEIKEKLIPIVSEFLDKVPNDKFDIDSKNICKIIIKPILPKVRLVSLNAST